MAIRYVKILLWGIVVMFIIIGISMGTPRDKHRDKPIRITQVYDLQMMNANTIYHEMDDMYKQGFTITNSETWQQFDVNFNIWTTKWEVHYVKQ